jgi:hypothetical protein
MCLVIAIPLKLERICHVCQAYKNKVNAALSKVFGVTNHISKMVVGVNKHVLILPERTFS